MTVLMVPIFALFGALLVDERGDVRRKVRGQRALFFQAEQQAWRAGRPVGEVPVDPLLYDALRRMAAIKAKSEQSLQLAQELVMAAPDEAMKVKAAHLVGLLSERDALLMSQEETIRQMATTVGRQRLLEERAR